MNKERILRSRQQIISRLTEARLEKQMSQAELAAVVGTQRSNICRMESGAQNVSLDMLIKVAGALGKDVNILLEERRSDMGNRYSLRLYDDEILAFTLEEKGLEGLKAHILSVNTEQRELFPLDLEVTDDGVIKWLERRVIPKNRAFVDEILKTLGLSINNTKGIIDVCKGLSLNDSYDCTASLPCVSTESSKNDRSSLIFHQPLAQRISFNIIASADLHGRERRTFHQIVGPVDPAAQYLFQLFG